MLKVPLREGGRFMSVKFRGVVTLAVVVLSAGLVTLVKLAVPAIHPAHSFLLYFFAIVTSALVSGRAGGFLATLAIAVSVPLFTARHTGTVDPEMIIRVSIFTAEGVVVTLIIDTLLRERERLRRARSAVEESRALLTNVIETVPTAVVGTDDGKVFLFNRAAEELTGYGRGEVLGKHPRDILVSPEWRAQAEERYADLTSPVVREPHRTPCLTKAGVTRVVEWRSAPLDAPPAKRLLSVGVDVTDIDSAEQERQRLMESEQAARRDAEEANRARDRFVSTLSHELRAPLTAIMGWTQLLLAGVGDEATQLQALTAVEENARAQARLIDDLLDYARLSAGKVNIEHSRVRICDVVRSAAEAFVPEARRKGLEIRNSANHRDVFVDGDENRLRQIFLNIIQNAVRYTDEGHIDLSAQVVDDAIRVSVCDTGRGIAPEFLPKIFERFTQETSGAGRQTAGVGLGLAIVKELVALHGGSIVASSEGPGKGARFTVEFPLAATAARG